jgi:diphosphomevalonate decarboxylase
MHVVPQRMRDISGAILKKDFDAFARITMADSNQFHAVALDTDLPIFYMNDVSCTIVAIVAIVDKNNRLALANTGACIDHSSRITRIQSCRATRKRC